MEASYLTGMPCASTRSGTEAFRHPFYRREEPLDLNLVSSPRFPLDRRGYPIT